MKRNKKWTKEQKEYFKKIEWAMNKLCSIRPILFWEAYPIDDESFAVRIVGLDL